MSTNCGGFLTDAWRSLGWIGHQDQVNEVSLHALLPYIRRPQAQEYGDNRKSPSGHKPRDLSRHMALRLQFFATRAWRQEYGIHIALNGQDEWNMSPGQVCKSQHTVSWRWEGCPEDGPKEMARYESTPHQACPSVRPRGNVNSMALELLPPLCVVGRLFFKEIHFQITSKQRYTRQNWVLLAESSSTEVSGSSGVPQFVEKLIFL